MSPAAALLLCLAAPAFSQQPAPAAAEPARPTPSGEAAPAAREPGEAADPIVVTGSLPLVVDVERVAQSCIACRRALARLQVAAAVPPRRERPARSVEEVNADRPRIGMRPAADVTSADAGGMIRYTEVETRARITDQRAQQRQSSIRGQADRFGENLMRYIGPIVDRQIQERSAPAAYAANDPAVRGIAVTDITAAVIAALDRDHADVDLLARPERD